MVNYEIFKPDLKRLQILSQELCPVEKTLKIAVHRNHSFEMISNVIEPFLNFSKLSAEFFYGDYDDSLNFTIENDSSVFDLHIIWLDLARYKDIDLTNWLNERINFLKVKTKNPIILFHTGEVDLSELEEKISGLLVVDIQDVINPLGEAKWDLAKKTYSGTRLSNKACLLLARAIGCRYIPAVVRPALKAIVVDLDNTFYQGVLAEDGVEGIVPNLIFQKKLKELKDKGFMLAIASKNELEDVKKLFRCRKDFLINWEDFAAYGINWNSKSENILEISKNLNIGIDSMVFIDDNAGEIENVKTSFPDIKIIEAVSEDFIVNVLEYFPGLFKCKTSFEDSIRSHDLKANEERQILVNQLSEEDYFKKLEIKLTYSINPISQNKRVSELLNKTNQFIFSYKRYNEHETEELLKDENTCVITVALSDRLSDSGIIAIFVGKKQDDVLVVDELCISCRALGRNLENKIINKMIKLAQKSLSANNNVKIEYKIGERNKPAINWIENYFSTKIETDGFLNVENICEESFAGLTVEVE